MISPVAIALALAFWAPYNGGEPVCPDGVTVHNVGWYGSPGSAPSSTYVLRVNGQRVRHCEMYADPTMRGLSVSWQCAWIARNIGASFFGLDPSRDRRNVMYRDGWVIPSACRRGGRWEAP